MRLEVIAHNKVVADIVRVCQRVNYLDNAAKQSELLVYARTVVREFCNLKIPKIIRQSLYTACLKTLKRTKHCNKGHCIAFDNVPNYVLSILLGTGIGRCLSLGLCNHGVCRYKDATMRIVADCHAISPNTLKLIAVRRYLCYDCDCYDIEPVFFQSIVSPLSNLSTLIMPNIADNNLLLKIGEFCNQLTELDISGSIRVNNNGILAMLQVSMYNRTALAEDPPSWIPQWRRNTFDKDISRSMTVRNSTTTNDSIDWTLLLSYCCQSTKLCGTLTKLNVSCTSVNNWGLLIAMMNVRGLQLVGDECNLGSALEMLKQLELKSVQLELIRVKAYEFSDSMVQYLGDTCTKLEKLSLVNPTASIARTYDLRCLPATLTELHLTDVTAGCEALIRGLCQYLLAPQSCFLQELTLTVTERPDQVVEFDLSTFLGGLISLNTLFVEGILMKWESQEPTYPPSDHLRFLRLSHIDGQHTLRRVLQHSPALVTLSLDRCNDLRLSDLTAMYRQLKTMDMLYVYWYHLPADTDMDEILRLYDVLPTLVWFGNRRPSTISWSERVTLQNWSRLRGRESPVTFLGPRLNGHWSSIISEIREYISTLK